MTDALQSQRKKRGAKWEALIVEECEILHAAGDAFVVRSPDALRVVGRTKGGEMKCVYAKKSAPDFAGLCNGGRAVSFDAKRSKAPSRFPLPKFGAGWWHQLEHLWTVSRMGGLGFLYVLHDPGPHVRLRRFVFPVVGDLVAGVDPLRVRSLRWADCDLYRVAPDASWFDWCCEHLGEWS